MKLSVWKKVQKMKLKPCPFCGGKPEVETHFSCVYERIYGEVTCKACRITIRGKKTYDTYDATYEGYDMKAQKYLQQLEVIETRIQNIQFDILQLKELAMSITPSYEGERVQSSGNLQKSATAVDRWVDKERELNKIIDELINKKLEIANTIEHLKKPKESGVLHMLYIQKKTFAEIAEHYERSLSWATSVHGRALQSLQKELDARDRKSAL